MAVLIKYNDGKLSLLKKSPRLEKLIELLGQPITEKIQDGYKLTWLYTKERVLTGVVKILKLKDNTKEIEFFEIV